MVARRLQAWGHASRSACSARPVPDRTATTLLSLTGRDATEAALRIGLAPYNTHDDVDRLLAGLDDFLDG